MLAWLQEDDISGWDHRRGCGEGVLAAHASPHGHRERCQAGIRAAKRVRSRSMQEEQMGSRGGSRDEIMMMRVTTVTVSMGSSVRS